MKLNGGSHPPPLRISVDRHGDPLVAGVRTIELHFHVIVRYGRASIVDGQRASDASLLAAAKTNGDYLGDLAYASSSVADGDAVDLPR